MSEVNFVRRHDELDLRTASTALFEGVPWTRVQATGAVVNAGSARLTNARGEPRPGQAVTIDAPYWDGHPPGADPRVLICDADWNRVYPGTGFQRTTDDSGRVDFTTFFGSELGLWWLHGRETADVRAFGVLPVGQLGSIAGPDQRIIDTIQQSRKLGLPAAPLAGASLSQVQAGLLEWLLAHWTYGPLGGSVAETGAFAPIRNVSGTAAAIVFYPAGDPAPLRSHLEAGTPLPYPAYAFVIPFKHVALPYPSLTSPVKHIWYADFGGGTWSDASKEPPYGKSALTLGQWEGTNGPARLGYAKPRPNEGLAFLGSPYPPPLAPSRMRLRYEHCVPGAAPSLDVVEAYSPIRLRFTDKSSGLPFGYDAKGKYVNLVGGFVERGKGRQPDRYVLPSGDYTVQITGTGRGRATLVVTQGDRTSTFAVRRPPRRQRNVAPLRDDGPEGVALLGPAGPGPRRDPPRPARAAAQDAGQALLDRAGTRPGSVRRAGRPGEGDDPRVGRQGHAAQRRPRPREREVVAGQAWSPACDGHQRRLHEGCAYGAGARLIGHRSARHRQRLWVSGWRARVTRAGACRTGATLVFSRLPTHRCLHKGCRCPGAAAPGWPAALRRTAANPSAQQVL